MRDVFLLISLLFVANFTVSAQSGGFGSIAGKVTDAQGAAISGAKVTAVNIATDLKTETTSTGNGDYQVLQLIPGQYRLEVEAPNFKKLERTDIRVQVSDRLTIDVPLEVGQVSETVSVTAEAPLLRTQDAQTGEVINQQMIQNLPQLNRDPLQLLVLSGNVQGGGGHGNSVTNDSDTRINGGRAQGIEYYVDGVTAGTGRGHGVSSVVTPTMEAVQEFKVITNGISAEYGRISGGAVELVTRSGTNDFHGQLFDYVKNDILNANSFEQNRLGGKKPSFRNNNFGAAVGGPVILPRFGEGGPSIHSGKNRTFFFFNYDGTRFVQKGGLNTASLPTEEMRNGDFSHVFVYDATTHLYNPFGPIGPNQERLELLNGDGKHILPSQISPVSRAIMQYVPLPNRAPLPGTSYFENYAAPVNQQFNQDGWALRLDHSITENHRIFGRFSRLNNDYQESRWRGPLQAVPHNFVKGGFGTTINYDWTISPTLLFNARVGGHYNPFTNGSSLADDFSSTVIPFDAVTKSILGAKSMPEVMVTYHGDLASQPGVHVVNSTTFDATASFVKILNRHTVKFGYEHRRYYDNFLDSGGGQFFFQQNPVGRFAKDDSWNNQDATNVFGAFLLGLNDKALIVGDTTRAMNLNYHGAYIQDDFKVSQKLTLNLGLRWDMETPTTERHNKLYAWDANAPSPFTIKPGYNWAAALAAATDPNGNPKPLTTAQVRTPNWVAHGFPTGALRIAGTPEYPSRYVTKWHPWQFAPRLGFAYQLNDKTVVRGSAGKMYLSTTGDPGGLATGGSGVPLADAADAGWHNHGDFTYRSVVPSFDNPFLPTDVSRYQRNTDIANYQATGGDPTLIAFNRDSRQPIEYTWGLGVQRELPKRFLVEVNYAANRGHGLLGQDLISRFPKDLFVPGNEAIYRDTFVESPYAQTTKYGAQQRLAFLEFYTPYFGPTTILGTNLGRSNYQSLNIRTERRLGEGFSFLLNYTLSRTLDNVGAANAGNGGIGASGTGTKRFQSVDTLRDVYGLSPLDEKHRLVAYYTIQFPIGRGRRFLGDTQGIGRTVLDYVVGGWELSGIHQWRSGRPLVLDTVNINTNNDIRVEQIFGSYATSDHNLTGSSFSGNKDIFIVGGDPASISNSARRLDPSKVITTRVFTYGDLPSVYGDIRQPSSFSHDISLMKKFPVFSEDGTRYLQVRMEGQNIFNLRGFGDYDTRIGSPTFGLITGSRYGPRQIQVSARFVF